MTMRMSLTLFDNDSRLHAVVHQSTEINEEKVCVSSRLIRILSAHPLIRIRSTYSPLLSKL